MADFSLHDLWWLKPKEQDNPLSALQLGVNIAQNKAKMDLAERDLANDIARTSLMRDEMLAKQKIQTMLAAGNAEMATAIAEVDDWTDDEQVSKVWATGAKNPMTVGGKAWLGAQHMHESARTAKRLEGEARSRMDRRTAQTQLANLEQERKDLLADSTIDLNDTRILDINERLALGNQKQALEEKKFELQTMLADSTMDYNDARIGKLQQDINLSERRLRIQEGNLALRSQDIAQKGRRLDARAQASYNNELKALNDEEKAKLKEPTAIADPVESDRLRKLYNMKRRGINERFYGPATTNAPAAAPSVPAAPSSKVRVIAPDGRAGFIPESQLDEALKAGYTKP